MAISDINKTFSNTVIHSTFGVGTIVSLPEDGGNRLVVKFDEGIKCLGLNTARKFITTDNRVLQDIIDKLNAEDLQRKKSWIVGSQEREAERLVAIKAEEEAARLEELHRAKEEQERKLEELHRAEMKNLYLRSVIQKYGVTRLCHLTPIRKIPIILADPWGIRATDFIPQEHLTRNDNDRYDNRSDHISCSVQYPNVKYYWTKQFADRDVKWAVVLINPEIIAKPDTLYCKVNAATRSGYYINKDFDCLFDNTIEYQKYDVEEQCYVNKTVLRASQLPSNVPTHEQAEILPHKNIPAQYITGIAFNDRVDMEMTKRLLNEKKISYPDLYWYPALFDSSLYTRLCNGIIPQEIFKLQGVKF